jgi:large subunit ribosomal protein L9
MIKVVLSENVSGLGKKGDIKDVADGYARNFLFPRKMAMLATDETIRAALDSQKAVSEEISQKKEELKKTASMIKSLTITLHRKEKDGKLFGSINPKEIAAELRKMADLEVPEKSIIIETPIKKTGRYEIILKLDKNIQEKLKLSVDPEK